MRVLVTGGLGYIGSAVVEELVTHDHQVVALSRTQLAQKPPNGVPVVVGDLTDADRVASIVADGRFDAVVHLGGLARVGESRQQPMNYFDVNVGGTLNLLRAIDAIAVSARPVLVYGSTTLVYGSAFVGAAHEGVTLMPESPYADTKVAAERLITAHAASGRVGATVLRIYNVSRASAGVGDSDTTRMIPNTLRVASGDLAHLSLLGDGSAVRDFVHVADVASAIRFAMQESVVGHCPVYNIGSGQGTRLLDLLACVSEVTGRQVPVVHQLTDAPPGQLIADISAARRGLGWEPANSSIHTIVADAWRVWAGN